MAEVRPQEPMNPPVLETDRRAWSRLSLAIPVFVRSKDENGKDFLEFATAINISAGGALVAVRRSLPLPAQVLLEIPSPPSPALALQPSSSRLLRARTLRVTHAEGYHLVGLKFLRPITQDAANGKGHRKTVRRKVASLV
jgi:PilZ domain